MKSLILAAGFCTRLFPITEYFPKALLPVGGKAILTYILDDVMKTGSIDEVALVTNHRYADIFSVWVKSRYPHRKVRIIDNGVTSPETRLGAIGDLAYATRLLKWQDDVLVLASDTLASLSLKEFLKFFQKYRGPVNAIFDTKDKEIIRKKLGCVKTDGDRLTEFIEKPETPKSTLTSIPFYIYPAKTIRLVGTYIKTGGSTDAPGSFMAWLIDKIPCWAYTVHGSYFDVGTVETYNKLAGSPLLLKRTPQK